MNTTMEVLARNLAQMRQAEEREDGVLVGHRFGGIAISGVADRATRRLRRLAYLNAVRLQPLTHRSGRRHRRWRTSDGKRSVLPVGSPTEFFGIAQGPEAEWLRQRPTPHSAVT